MDKNSGPEKVSESGTRAGLARFTRLSPATAGRVCLVKDMNCATATLEAAQNVFGIRDDLLLKSVSTGNLDNIKTLVKYSPDYSKKDEK